MKIFGKKSKIKSKIVNNNNSNILQELYRFNKFWMKNAINLITSPVTFLSLKMRKNKIEEPEIVLLDHGMYRRLDPSFRITYCNLWKGLLTSNKELGLQATRELGIDDPDLYDILSLISVNRSPDSNVKLGDTIDKKEE